MVKREDAAHPTLGEVIEDYREKAGMSRLALAKAAGLDPSIVNRLGSGERDSLQFSNLCKLAEALCVSLDDIAKAAGLVKGRPRNMTVSAENARLRATLKKLQLIIEKSVGPSKRSR